jgi:hypothetical protein
MLINTELGGMFVAGVMLGQVVLLGIWLALVSIPLPQRVVGVAFAAALLWLISCSVLRFGPEAQYQYLKPIVFPLLLLEIVFGTLASWVFFAGVRRWLHWRIVQDSHGVYGANASRFSLRHLMIGTAMTCLVLAFARIVLPPVEAMWPTADSEIDLYGLGIGHLIALAILVLNLLFLLPCLAILFLTMESRTWRSTLGVTVAVALISVGVKMLIEVVAARALLNWDAPGLMLGITNINAAQFVVIMVTLFALGPLGWRFAKIGTSSSSKSTAPFA